MRDEADQFKKECEKLREENEELQKELEPFTPEFYAQLERLKLKHELAVQQVCPLVSFLLSCIR